MIIIEGPDGAGKTTLLNELAAHYTSIPVHERASDGVNGPVKNLYRWAERDVGNWTEEPVHFYDRHPFISEYIYGPVVRGTMDPQFHTTHLRRYVARRALTIVCLPPLDIVKLAVSDERDMAGVTTHIDTIWHLYASLPASWASSAGIVVYDWTRHNAADHIHPHINSHRTHWSVTR